MVVDGSLTGDCLFNQVFGLVDAVGNRDLKHRFSVKAGHLDLPVSGHDDGFGISDFFRGQHVLGTAGAVSLGFQGNAHLFGSVFQVLGSHVGVGDTSGAGSHSQKTVAVGVWMIRCRGLSSRSLRNSDAFRCAVFGGFCVIDDF